MPAQTWYMIIKMSAVPAASNISNTCNTQNVQISLVACMITNVRTQCEQRDARSTGI